MQAIAERNGIELDIGNEKEFEDLEAIVSADAEDGPDPQQIAARMAAHLGHRIPGVRKLEKRLEGRDKTSGIWSDAGILIGQLYIRNKTPINKLASEILSGMVPGRKHPANPAANPNGTIDFGEVGGPSSNGGGNGS